MVEDLPFEIAARDYPGELSPKELFVVERVNEPFEITARVSVASANAKEAVASLRGDTIEVSLATSVPARAFYATCFGVDVIGDADGDETVLELKLGPRLSLLGLKLQARIFQNMSTAAIVESVAGGVHQPVLVQLADALPERAYTCQYHETDLAFVERLLAEDGLFYWFEHEGGEARMIIADSCDAYRPIEGDPRLRFEPATDDRALAVEERLITSLRFETKASTEATVRCDFDVKRPAAAYGERFAGGARAPLADREQDRELVRSGLVHDVHLGAREEARVLSTPPQRYIEALRADAAVSRGTSACRRLAPGRTIQVEHAPSAMPTELVIAGVSHVVRVSAAGDVGPTYANGFHAVPRGTPLRPAPRSTKPAATCETAMVVGPEGEEIHTDHLGRVKVQFHWDRDGERDARSSCWLRVGQVWSGAGFGAQFIPRVGTEVLVTFMGGDPDRPIVTGSLYNAVTPTPFALPAEKEKLGIRSRSTGEGNGGGCNEFVFDDTRGRESVSLRSQNVLQLSAIGDALAQIGGDAEAVVGGTSRERIAGDRTVAIGGDASMSGAGTAQISIAGRARCAFGSAVDLDVDGDMHQRTGGSMRGVVEGSRTTIIGGPKREALDTTAVHGSSRIGASGEITIDAQRGLALRCGSSLIHLLPDRLVIDAEVVELRGRRRIGATQGTRAGVSWNLDGAFAIAASKVTLASADGATLVLDADAHLDGAFVKLNCGGSSAAAIAPGGESPETASVRFELSAHGLPPGTTSATLVIAGPGGETLEKECAVGGAVVIEGKPGEPYRLVEVRVGDRVIPVRSAGQRNSEDPDA